MTMKTLPQRLTLLLWPALALAQAMPLGSAAPAASAPASAASSATETSATPPVAASAPAQPAPPSCAELTSRAMSAELRASTGLAQNQALEQVDKLFNEATQLWMQAQVRCEGRSRERAQGHLSDNLRTRAQLAERLAAGQQCELSGRDAAALQELANQAVGERRFSEAAALYRKAETMWDLAAEYCIGNPQAQARKRQEQSGLDAHNAQHCAPLYDKAREATQTLRGSALPPTERQQQSLVVETYWRDAGLLCRGEARNLALNSAQALARERGTPWVATRPAGESAPALPVPAAAPTSTPAATPLASTTISPTTVATAGPAPTAAPTPSAARTAVTPAPAPSTAPAPVPVPAPVPAALAGATPAPDVPATAIAELDVRSGDTRYKGRFVREPGQVLSGHGRVEWSNGDAYEGQLVRSKRHGQGEFIWASGQRYKGDWVEDEPTGRGLVQFPNGNRWEGQVLKGDPQGEGRMAYASGDVYVGQMQGGQAHGRGLYTWASGQRLEAHWQAGQAQGQGKLRFANGNDYQGELRDGIPHGQGRLVYASGDLYQGGFAQGLAHGQGRYQWRHGDHYEGAWQQGKKEGQGVFRWANGDRWEGLFRNDEADDDQGQLTKAAKPAQTSQAGGTP